MDLGDVRGALTRNAEELIVPLREALDRIETRVARLIMRVSCFSHLSCVRLHLKHQM